MKLNQIALTALLALLASNPIQAASTDSTARTPQIVTFNQGDRVTGSLAVIQAFSAIRENSATLLLSALNSAQNPVNETFSITSNGKEIKLRLVHAAVLAKSPISLSLLISRGARIAAKDTLGKSAAHYASFGAPNFGDIFDFRPYVDGEVASSMLELLQAEGLEMDGKDIEQRTPLHFAALAGDPKVINQLTSFGVALDPKDINGHTPTQLAVRAGYLSAIPQLLKRAGATSSASSIDYLIGAKNDVSSFALVHPIATVATFIASGLAWFSYGLFSAGKALASPVSRRAAMNARDDGSLPPPDFGLPSRAFVAGIGGGGGSSGMGGGVILGASPSSSQSSRSASAATSSRSVETKAPTAADAATATEASSPREPEAKKSPSKQYRDATDRVNGLRQSEDSAQIQAALQEAERLLRDVRDLEIAEERRHLLGALGSFAKVRPEGNPERAHANRLIEAYKKKAKRH